VAGEEGHGGLPALRRAADLGHLGGAVLGADVERVGRVGASRVHLLAVAVGSLAQEDVEGEAPGSAGPVAAARLRLQLAVAVRAPVLLRDSVLRRGRPVLRRRGPVLRRSGRRRRWGRLGGGGGGSRDGAVVGAAVEGVGGVGAGRVDRLPFLHHRRLCCCCYPHQPNPSSSSSSKIKINRSSSSSKARKPE
jgi:hypothetical protein